MSRYFLVPLIFIHFSCFAQLYINMSANLPAIGAQGSSMDVRAADLDGDTDLDIVLANEFQPNTILSNDGLGNFTNTTTSHLPQRIQDSEDVIVEDFNQDGFLDLIFCSEDDIVLQESDVHEYYLGQDGSSFIKSDYQFPDTEANAVLSEDINADLLPDVLFGNKGPTGVFINNGDGTFTEESNRLPQFNRTTQDLNMVDVDGDKDLDLFEGNENGNLLFINDGTGHFTDETASRLPQGLTIETRKVTFGDIDGDKDLDVFLSNVEFSPGNDRQNRLFLNDGKGFFTDVTASQLPIDNDLTVDAIFEDVDVDGDLDIVVANVFGSAIKVYVNDGSGAFEDKTLAVLGENYFMDALGLIAEDFNGDGLKDIYICDRKSPNSNNKDLLLIRNSIISGQNEFGGESVDMTLKPSAGHGEFTIQLKNEQPEMILVTSLDGRLLQAIKSIPSDSLKLDLTDYSNGTYLIVAQYKENKQIIRKVIKE